MQKAMDRIKGNGYKEAYIIRDDVDQTVSGGMKKSNKSKGKRIDDHHLFSDQTASFNQH